MASLLDYVGTDSRVGRRNNIWTSNHLFFMNTGEGIYSELSPDRVTFSGNTTFMGITERIYLQVELLSNTKCNVIFKSTSRNIPYQTQNNIFVASLYSNVFLSMSRYNTIETQVRVTVYSEAGEVTDTTYHIQLV